MRLEGHFEDGSTRNRRCVDEGGEPGANFGVQWFVGEHSDSLRARR